MFQSVEIPAQTRATKRHFSVDEVEQAAAMLAEGQAVSDGVVYSEPYKKLQPRARAQYQGWYLRQELASDGLYDTDQTTCKTWADGDGFRYAVTLKK